MGEVEALNNIAKAIEHLAGSMGSIGFILFLFLIFKSFTNNNDEGMSKIAESIKTLASSFRDKLNR